MRKTGYFICTSYNLYLIHKVHAQPNNINRARSYSELRLVDFNCDLKLAKWPLLYLFTMKTVNPETINIMKKTFHKPLNVSCINLH